MKKLLALLASAIVSFSVHAADFKEGVNYKVLDFQKAEHPQVVEYFSFYCSHCLAFEKLFKSMEKDLPSDVQFEKRSISFIGREMGVPVSKAYAMMKVLGNDHELVPEMFRKIQRSDKPLRSEAELREWFIEHGVSKTVFDATYNSEKVLTLQRSYDEGFRKARLTAVPGFIINNKYQIILGSFKNYEEFLELVEYLLDK
ncbi:thiol:disulfide interchange protein DsbA/DsbL [Vibrio coralliilyticus]|uniref:Thiol:disulfide interchange protein n=3 Tax=Vibrio TaxID=662 RepID=A0AAN0W083_9VIBR|nr:MULTISPECIES: thiol:disulfide interchange protein DsbA/DsbL [Vibrio]CAH1587840.1 Thiol:disulfide interchange protein DsbA [Vibrio jasicida]AIW22430.1 hypothetical protein IX92_25525 [Vibrio coralliilyticus]MCZ2799088.1 thiol:disulfide interchange protein DsbA/DsbL [Vibrio alginolyticus]NOH36990.1 thiol:disulfide interchange protein DsbA/DsbL [Vibrio coralliilyticus]PAW02506.1 hypothetical protein CKJ79_17730 [Vibrio coralliilyticus]